MADSGGRTSILNPRTRRGRILLGTLLGGLLGTLFSLIYISGILETAELLSFDLRTRWTAKPATGVDDVAVVLIDDNDIRLMDEDYFETWPFPRNIYGLVAEYCQAAGAKAVVFDILLSEAHAQPQTDIEFAQKLNELNIPVILAMSSAPKESPLHPSRVSGLEKFKLEDTGSVRWATVDNFASPMPEFMTAADGVACVEFPTDADNAYRGMAPFFDSPYGLYPNPAVAASALLNPKTDLTNEFSLHTNEHQHPLTDRGIAIHRFPSLESLYEPIPFVAMLDSLYQFQNGDTELKITPDRLRDKVVFVGASTAGLKDLRKGPYAEYVPGVYFHAISYDNLIHNEFMTPRNNTLTVITILIICIAIGIAFELFSATWATAASVLIAAAYFGISLAAFSSGTWLALVTPMTGGVFSILGMAGFKYATEGRAKRAVKAAFGHYLSSAVMEKVLDEPEKFLQRWGERKKLTVLFLDFAGFTTVSEMLNSNDLVELLNKYHGSATDCIMEQEGTFDKYIGDAQVAFWGDPFPQEDQARRACLAALNIQKKLVPMTADDQAKGLPPLRARVGLNTGQMHVGNMGSGEIFDYTVIGDQVNLGARLEGVNKEFGTKIIISDATRKEAGDEFHTRVLADIVVKGKKKAVRIYELACLTREATSSQKEIASLFEQLLERFSEQDWDGAEELLEKVLQISPDDGPATQYQNVIAHFRENPPDEGWHGEYIMTSK